MRLSPPRDALHSPSRGVPNYFRLAVPHRICLSHLPSTVCPVEFFQGRNSIKPIANLKSLLKIPSARGSLAMRPKSSTSTLRHHQPHMYSNNKLSPAFQNY